MVNEYKGKFYSKGYESVAFSLKPICEGGLEEVLSVRKELKGHLADCGPSD